MKVPSPGLRRVLIALTFGMLPAAACAAAPSAAASKTAPAGTEAQDLAAIVDYGLLENFMRSVGEHTIDVDYRHQLETSAQDVALETQYPGLRQTRVDAALAFFRQSFAADTATIRKQAEDFWRRSLSVEERAAIAGYLRTPAPQRLLHEKITARRGDVGGEPTTRMLNEYRAKASPQEKQAQAAFFATPAGRKYTQVFAGYKSAVGDKYLKLVGDRVMESLDSADEAAGEFIDRAEERRRER